MAPKQDDARKAGLEHLKNSGGKAGEYFSSLPPDVQEMILERREAVQQEQDNGPGGYPTGE